MFYDTQNLYSDNQAVTATAASENVIDHTVAGVDKGQPVALDIRVQEDFSTLTSLTVAVETDDNESFSSSTTLVKTAAIAAADLVNGYRFPINYLPDGCERFTRLKFTVNGSNATAGKITAGILFDRQTNA